LKVAVFFLSSMSVS